MNKTNAELIKSMTTEELTGFLFNIEFIKTLAYPEGKTYGSYPTLKNWLEQEATIDISNRTEIMEYQNKKRYKEVGISEEQVQQFYENHNSSYQNTK